MRAFVFAAVLSAVGVGASAHAVTVTAGQVITIEDMTLAVPDGWSLSQNAKDEGTIILGFKDATRHVTMYAKAVAGMDMRATFVNGSNVVRDVRTLPRNRYSWQVIDTSKRTGSTTAYVSAFMTEFNGHTYYGYARAGSTEQAAAAAQSFLDSLR